MRVWKYVVTTALPGSPVCDYVKCLFCLLNNDIRKQKNFMVAIVILFSVLSLFLLLLVLFVPFF